MNKTERRKEKVLFLMDAINSEDYESARECLNPDFKFQEFLVILNNSQKYLDRIKRLKPKYKIKKIFSDEYSVCVFYDIRTNSENEITAVGLFEFDDDRIRSLRQFSDPIKAVAFSEDGTD